MPPRCRPGRPAEGWLHHALYRSRPDVATPPAKGRPLSLDQIAADLLAAYTTGKTLAPRPGLSVDDAYEIQQLQARRRTATWLANTLIERGTTLEAGHVILTGALTAAVPVQPGDTVSTTIDRRGSVTAVFD